jgi:transposase
LTSCLHGRVNSNPGAIHATEVIDFFGHLLRHLAGKLLVVWDGLPQHRARLVTEFIRAQRGRLAIERLPSYAPELNPVEYIWGYWKHHALPNFCPRDFGQLSYQARRALRRMCSPQMYLVGENGIDRADRGYKLLLEVFREVLPFTLRGVRR